MKYKTKDMIDFLRDIENLDKVQATHCVEDILLFIRETLLNGDEVELKNIGVLKTTLLSARKVNAFDFTTNQAIVKNLPSRKVLKLRTSSVFKRDLNTDEVVESGGSNE